MLAPELRIGVVDCTRANRSNGSGGRGQYAGILQFLALFIILGIGVDDVFVFFDTFQQASHAAKEATLEQRLAYTFAKSGKAMLVTSCTSALAFVANVLSAIPAGACEKGTFAGKSGVMKGRLEVE